MDAPQTLLSFIRSPFRAPVYYVETTGSTMDAARLLAKNETPSGTVVIADYQKKGRGRFVGRRWLSEAGESLLFTILFRYKDFSQIPKALTLRMGLAVSVAVDSFLAPLESEIKWPNDILVNEKKLVGILTEGFSRTVFIGVGVNVLQRQFPVDRDARLSRATSIALAKEEAGLGDTFLDDMMQTYSTMRFGDAARPCDIVRFLLLEKILAEMENELYTMTRERTWRERLESRLYKLDQEVAFVAGASGTDEVARGIITGIGPDGELLVCTESGTKNFVSGEIRL